MKTVKPLELRREEEIIIEYHTGSFVSKLYKEMFSEKNSSYFTMVRKINVT